MLNKIKNSLTLKKRTKFHKDTFAKKIKENLDNKEFSFLDNFGPELFYLTMFNYLKSNNPHKESPDRNEASFQMKKTYEALPNKKNVHKAFPFLSTLGEFQPTIISFCFADILKDSLERKRDKKFIKDILYNIRSFYLKYKNKNLINFEGIMKNLVDQAITYTNMNDNSGLTCHEFLYSLSTDDGIINTKDHTEYLHIIKTGKPQGKKRKYIRSKTRKYITPLLIGGAIMFGADGSQTIPIPNPGEKEKIANTTTTNKDKKISPEKKKQREIEKTVEKIQKDKLFEKRSTGITVISMENEEEYIAAAKHIGCSHNRCQYSKEYDFFSLKTTIDKSNFPKTKIDRNQTKGQIYKIISMLRGEKEYTINDLEYSFSDEIAFVDLPKGILGLYVRNSDTDQNIFLDISLLESSQQKQEQTLVHEIIHGIVGKGTTKIRNEGMTDALTNYSFYAFRGIDTFTPLDPYAPHIINFITINTIYSSYSGFEDFSLNLAYNYKQSNQEHNNLYASGLRSVLNTYNSKKIDPAVIAFFCGGKESLKKAMNNKLATPNTKEWFATIVNNYDGSFFSKIEEKNRSEEKKINTVIEYIKKYKDRLITDSITDDIDLPTSQSNVHPSNQKPNEDTSKENSSTQDSSSKNKIKKTEKQRKEYFTKKLAKEIASSTLRRTGLYHNSNYDEEKGEIDPNYFKLLLERQLKYRLKNKIRKDTGEYQKDVDNIVQEIFNNHIKKHIPQLSKDLQQEVQSEKVFKKRIKEEFSLGDFIYNKSGSNSDILLNTVGIDEKIGKNKTFKKVYKKIEKKIKEGSLIPKNYLKYLFLKDITKVIQDHQLEKSVPNFKYDFFKPDYSAEILSEEYGSFINETIDVDLQKTGNAHEVHKTMKKYGVSAVESVKIQLFENNEETFIQDLKNNTYYKEALASYLNPILEHKSRFKAVRQDIFEKIEENIFGLSGILACMILFLFVFTIARKKRDGKKTNKLFRTYFKEIYPESDGSPLGNLSKQLINSHNEIKDISIGKTCITGLLLMGMIVMVLRSPVWITLNKNTASNYKEYFTKNHPRKTTNNAKKIYNTLKANPEAELGIALSDKWDFPYNSKYGSFSLSLKEKKEIRKYITENPQKKFTLPENNKTKDQIEIILKNAEYKERKYSTEKAPILPYHDIYIILYLYLLYHFGKNIILSKKQQKKILKTIMEQKNNQGLPESESRLDLLYDKIYGTKRTKLRKAIFTQLDEYNKGYFQEGTESLINRLIITSKDTDTTSLEEDGMFSQILKEHQKNINTNTTHSHINRNQIVTHSENHLKKIGRLHEFEKKDPPLKKIIINLDREKLTSIPNGKNLVNNLRFIPTGKGATIISVEEEGAEIARKTCIEFSQIYLPYIILANARNIEIEYYANHLPLNAKKILFSNVSVLKKWQENNGKSQHNNIETYISAIKNAIQSPIVTIPPEQLEKNLDTGKNTMCIGFSINKKS